MSEPGPGSELWVVKGSNSRSEPVLNYLLQLHICMCVHLLGSLFVYVYVCRYRERYTRTHALTDTPTEPDSSS